jgi:acyl carrier protein
MQKATIKTFFDQNFSEELPVDPIVSRFEINFKQDGLRLSSFDHVNNFMKIESSIQNKVPLDESILRWLNNHV